MFERCIHFGAAPPLSRGQAFAHAVGSANRAVCRTAWAKRDKRRAIVPNVSAALPTLHLADFRAAVATRHSLRTKVGAISDATFQPSFQPSRIDAALLLRTHDSILWWPRSRRICIALVTTAAATAVPQCERATTILSMKGALPSLSNHSAYPTTRPFSIANTYSCVCRPGHGFHKRSRSADGTRRDGR